MSADWSGHNDGIVSSSSAEGAVSGIHNVGGLAGYNDADISDCAASGDATGQLDFVGGLIGWNYRGDIGGCTASGAATGNDYVAGLVGSNDEGLIMDSTAEGNASGNDYVGGLVGQNTGGLISASAASGTASGNDYVGGLVGDNGGDISHCTAGGDVTGREHVDPLVGRNYGSPDYQQRGHRHGEPAKLAAGAVTPVAKAFWVSPNWALHKNCCLCLVRCWRWSCPAGGERRSRGIGELARGVAGWWVSVVPPGGLQRGRPALARIHRWTRMDGVRTEEGG